MKQLLLLICCVIPFSLFAQKADILIKNGRIVDGSGNSWFYGDVAIRKGKITGIGNLEHTKAKQIIDARKQIIAPGFIDVHTHIEG
ncbi:MAG TPA: hypothetical protein VLZ28_01755, partial [Daejeonella sp.]|nr:hypothetical protein [Daejeonella sp.]